MVALGGFGRRWLFPFSDIDVLFLHAGNGTEEKFKEPIRKFSQDLWDLGLKLSPATRTLAECGRFEAANSEFAISLLDCRYLAGDHRLFARLHDDVIPKLLARESEQIVKRLGELTRTRHGKFGSTVFHLEPNVKDGPGRPARLQRGLLAFAAGRDRAVSRVAAATMRSCRPRFRSISRRRSNALMSIRCFLHFRHNRDDNTLTWESQDAAAAQKIGVANSPRTIRATSDRRRRTPQHCRMDAAVLQPRAHSSSCVRANAGGDSGCAPFAASPISAIALAPFERGIFGRGRDAPIAAARGAWTIPS